MTTITRYPASVQDTMNALARTTADQQLHIVVRFGGRIDPERMQRAMRLAMEREPVLGCRFEVRSNRAWFVRRSDLNELALCLVIETNDPQAELMAFAATPVLAEQDPLIQGRIYRTPQDDTLVIKVNHVVADGAGAKEIAYLVADTYACLEQDPAYNPPMGKPGYRGQGHFLLRAGLANLYKAFPKQLKLAAPQFSLPFSGSESTGRRFALRRIGPERLRALKAWGKAHGATLNDVLLAAFYRTLAAMGSPAQGTPLPIQVPIDMRAFLAKDQPQTICNLSSGLFPAPVLSAEDSFEQVLSKVVETMARWKSRRPGVTGAILMELAMAGGYRNAQARFNQMVPMGSKVSPLLLSNLGILDASRLVFGSAAVLDAFALTPIMLGHGLMLGVSSYRDTLTLSIGYCQGLIAESTIEGLLDRVMQELHL
jgi:NRPS condensation-like uncharacterized protein